MSSFSGTQKTNKNSINSVDKTPTAKTPTSMLLKYEKTPKDYDPLILTPLQGYNSTDISGILLDDYGSQSRFNELLGRHPTQSFFSMHSMLRAHRITDRSQQKSSTLNPRMIYSFCGELYRKCCFTSIGMKLILCTNILLVLLNLYLIIYEAILLCQPNAYLNTQLPVMFFVCDVFITMVLIIDVVLHWCIGYRGSCYQYLCNSTVDNKVDAVVMTLSVVCCVLYITDFENAADVNNFLFLVIRITRDVIRIARCYFFFKLLHENLAFDFNQLHVSTWNVQVPQKEAKSMKSNLWWDRYACGIESANNDTNNETDNDTDLDHPDVIHHHMTL